MSLTPDQVEFVRNVSFDLARQGETEELLEFIEHGLDVNSIDESHNSLLMLAAYRGQADTVRMLLEQGADPDLPNAAGQTVIAGAIFKGEAEVVALLKAAGANLDIGIPTARKAAMMFGREDLLDD